MQFMSWGPRDLDAASPEQIAEIIERIRKQSKEHGGQAGGEVNEELGFTYWKDEGV